MTNNHINFNKKGLKRHFPLEQQSIRGQFGLGPGRLNRYTIQRLALSNCILFTR